jgi:hypothetical protein
VNNSIFILFFVFQIKHWLADYPLQRPWMLGKFKPGLGFVAPLATHCGVHALLTWAIVLFVKPQWAMQLAAFDFCTHFVMDRIKASPKMMGRWKPLFGEGYFFAQKMKSIGENETVRKNARAALRGNRLFWDALGFDQMVHHFTHYTIIWLLVH